MNPKKTAHRNHYLPEFYLHAWADSDGMVWVSDKPSGEHQAREPDKYSPRSVGCVRDLYTANDLLDPTSTSDSVETTFFQKLDNEAARVHQALLRDGSALSRQERLLWAQFMIALHERSPHHLAEVQEQLLCVSEGVWERMRARASDADALETVDDVRRSMNHELVAKALSLELMVKTVRREDIRKRLSRFRWVILDTGDFRLFTGNDALVINNGHDASRVYLITMALAPGLLLVVLPVSWTLEPDEALCLAFAHNLLVSRRSRRIVSNYPVSPGEREHLLEMAKAYANGSAARRD